MGYFHDKNTLAARHAYGNFVEVGMISKVNLVSL